MTAADANNNWEPPPIAGGRTAAAWMLPPPRGFLVTVEGVWGAGKTTLARLLHHRVQASGLSSAVVHYGPRPATLQRLSDFLEATPLRSRAGRGGYAAAHHATVDVFLRLCREAHQHLIHYPAALERHAVVILDHGVYAKLAYALAVLMETAPSESEGSPTSAALLDALSAVVAPWFLHPDLAVFLDTPWPLARERAIARGHGGGDPAAIERLLFLPRYDQAYRRVLAAHSHRVTRIRVGLRPAEDVANEADDALATRLRIPTGSGPGAAPQVEGPAQERSPAPCPS